MLIWDLTFLWNLDVIDDLVAARSNREARAVLDGRLRRYIAIVYALTRAAGEAHGSSEVEDLLARARLVAGEDWPAGPAVVTALLAAGADLRRSLDGPSARAANDAVHAVEGSGFSMLAHPDIVPQVHLALSFLHRDVYRATGDVAALERAVLAARAAVASLHRWDYEEKRYVRHLLDCLAALDDAGQGQATLADPFVDDPAAPTGRVDGLAAELDSTWEIEPYVARLRADAVGLSGTGPAWFDQLDRIAAAQHKLGRVGTPDQMRQAVDDYRNAAEATPPQDPQRLTRLVRLARVHLELRNFTLDDNDCAPAVADARVALDALPADHAWRAPLLALTAPSLVGIGRAGGLALDDESRLRRFTELMDTVRAALAATPIDDPARPTRLARLAVAATEGATYFCFAKEEDRRGEALQLLREALAATSPEGAHWYSELPAVTEALGSLLLASHPPERLAEFHAAVRATVDAQPSGGEERRSILAELACFLAELRYRIDDRALLETAVDLARQAFAGRPEVEEIDMRSIGSLRRDQRLEMVEQLEELTADRALADEAAAIRAAADESIRASAERAKPERDDDHDPDPVVVAAQVAQLRDAVAALPDDDPDRPSMLDELAAMQYGLTELTRAEEDLRQAIADYRAAPNATEARWAALLDDAVIMGQTPNR